MTNLVSVVIPTKNGMPYIVECVESVLKSSYSNIEVLISDDQSTDGTLEYLSTIEDSRLKVFPSDSSLSMSENWNRAKNLASGKYVKLLCSDDTVLKHGIANQVNALDVDSELILVSSKRQILDKSDRIRMRNIPRRLTGKIPCDLVIRESLMSGTNILGEPSSVMFRNTESFRKLSWSSEWKYLLDFEFYCRFLLGNLGKNVMLLNSVDATFRIHSGSVSARISRTHVEEFIRLAHNYRSTLRLSKRSLQFMRFKAIVITKVRNAIFWYLN